ncbi:hypothetical protein G9A89_021796 [Geosiphon pyriformis]|nr:hypothetical protein G9A89_021796 [Geosiphon pyriformis]
MSHLNRCSHDDNEIWQMALTKIKEASPEEIKMIKNNPSKPIELDWNPEPVINLLDLEQFYEHYQELAFTREEQKQWLEEINTRLCDHCLISCDFQYYNEYDFIYNPPPCIIYTISEEEEPINSCVSESESIFNLNLNSDNENNKNNSFSSIQINNSNNQNNSNSDLNSEQYIALPNLTKKQELKSFSDNNEGIMPEYVHDTNAEFDLRYSRKDSIKLEPYLHTCIDLKIALEISATTMVQLAFRIVIERKVRDQVQIFEAEATLCESEEIGLVNIYIPAKNHSYIKIPIYNNTKHIIKIPEETTIEYLTTKIEEQPPNSIPDFLQLCEYVDITSQTIYRQEKYYLLQPEQLEQMNLENLDPLQHMQLKMLFNNFNNIFASKNEFGRTDIIQHQIKTGNAMPIKQKAYRVLSVSHEIIHQEINQMLDNRLIQSLMSL